jgi:hypothetical protein
MTRESRNSRGLSVAAGAGLCARQGQHSMRSGVGAPRSTLQGVLKHPLVRSGERGRQNRPWPHVRHSVEVRQQVKKSEVLATFAAKTSDRSVSV